MKCSPWKGPKPPGVPTCKLQFATWRNQLGASSSATANDLRAPLRKVNEEIGSYYELTFDPHIQNYDGGFRKLTVVAGRKDVVIHARNGYFALPPEARALGLETYELPLLRAISD